MPGPERQAGDPGPQADREAPERAPARPDAAAEALGDAPATPNDAPVAAGEAPVAAGEAPVAAGDAPSAAGTNADGEPPAGGAGADGEPPEGGDPERRAGMLPAALQTYGSQLAMAVLSLGNALIVARALGPTGRGEVAFLTAVAFLGSNMWTFGVQEANVNLAGSEPGTRGALATNSLILSVLCGGVGALLMALLLILVPAAGAGVAAGLLALVLLSLPMLVLNSYLRFLIQGSFGFGVTNLAWMLPSVINVSVNGALAVFSDLSVATSISVWVAGQTIATLILVWWVSARSSGFGRPSASLARRSLVFGIKSHIGRIMLLANYRIDQWLLGAIAGTRQLGQYSVAVAWAEALFLLPTALSAVQRPTIVRASQREAVRVTSNVFRLALIVTSVLAIGLIVAAPFLCVTIFGEEFRPAIADLRLLATGAFGVVALKQLGNSLTGRNHPIAASVSIGCAFVFTIVLDVILIPAHGDVGAAIASSVAYTAGGIVIAIVFARTLDGRLRDLVPRPSDIRRLRDTASAIAGRLRGRPLVDPAAETPPA